MAVNRVPYVDQRFRETIAARRGTFKKVNRGAEERLFNSPTLSQAKAVSLLESQLTSRWLDYVARELKAEGKSYYTIGSAGHEGNAMVGALTRYTDPAFLHYRSGGFYFARARQLPGQTPIFDACLSLTASKEDPISGGRHKVWGSDVLNIPPQTSTIASHLPKAMGMAFFLKRRRALGTDHAYPSDCIVVCSFGDASANHSTAVGAINAAAWVAYQHLPMPVLFVCEDNGIGISVHTPKNWIESNFKNRAGIDYFQADGLDFTKGWDMVNRAVDHCRTRRRPTFLHLKTVRLLGHAGSDVETNYHSREQIEATEAFDPIITTALQIIDAGIMSPDEVLDLYDEIGERVKAAGEEASSRIKQTDPVELASPLFPEYGRTKLPAKAWDLEKREQYWQGKPPEKRRPRHLAQLVNWGLQDLCLQYPDLFMFGEDVARKGGVYHVTADLYEKFGVGRIFNTLLDEQSILGLAIGAGHAGLMPIPEIQYLAYLHNAADQLRGEACSLSFFSERRFRNPMVVRIAGFAYQRGFGGHFHNDNAIAALRDIPGILLVTASNGPDAVRLMRSCIEFARQEGAVVAFIEPIALYMQKDLVDKGDFLFDYPEPGDYMPFGEVGYYGDESADILVISYANGTYLSRQAMADLEKDGIKTRLLDLRFLTPLNREAIIDATAGKKEVVIVDECRQTGSVSEEITTIIAEAHQARMPHITRICGHDTYIPLGEAWEMVLPSRKDIYETIKRRAQHG